MEGKRAGRNDQEAERGDLDPPDLAPQPLVEGMPGSRPPQAVEVGGDLVGAEARRPSGIGGEGLWHGCVLW